MQEGSVNQITGITACTLGIFLGDYFLYLTGKELHGFLRKRESFQFLFESQSYENLAYKLKNNYAKTIFLARFMPGTRLPIYTFAGMTSKSSLPFLAYTFIASIFWTPIMVSLAFAYGETFKKVYQTNKFYLYLFICIGSFFLTYQLILLFFQKERRRETITSLLKISKLEFWPIWVFYIPLVPYVCYLIVRYGSIKNIVLSNPGIPFGGIAFESKADILTNLKSETIAKFQLISPKANSPLENQIDTAIQWCGGNFPFILKPDIGERGFGVKLVYNKESIQSIITQTRIDFILQEYHPGPLEAGIFYYRYPNEGSGKILSITDKFFPIIEGDGKSNLKDLILNHPRFRFQAKTFLIRMKSRLSEIPQKRETLSLGFAGNHIQGCLFCDGSHLITQALENKIDEISKGFKGFYFGRYDIRYSDAEDLKKGKNFKIIELNGAMSESTNLYDPNFSIFHSYQILFRQWKILFQIGKLNHNLGLEFPTYRSFFAMMKSYNQYKKQIDPIAKQITS
jgi:membrane protein DedA with SNARE-associated domain